MTRRAIPWGLAAALLLGSVGFLGCYTVLKHPQQVSMADDSGSRRSCSDCHDQAFYYHDPFMYRYFDRYGYADRWYGYYYDPWWYDDYWYYDPWDGESVPIQREGRTRWGDEPARPVPPDRGAATAVGTSGTAVTPSAGKPESSSGSSGSDQPAQTVKETDQRTRWGNEPQRPKPPSTPEKTQPETKGGETPKSEPKKEKDTDN